MEIFKIAVKQPVYINIPRPHPILLNVHTNTHEITFIMVKIYLFIYFLNGGKDNPAYTYALRKLHLFLLKSNFQLIEYRQIWKLFQ